MKSLWIIAQGGATEAPTRVGSTPVGQQQTTTTAVTQDGNNVKTGTQPPPNPWSGVMGWALPIMLVVFMYLILFRGPKKREQEQRKMIQSLKKNDKVRTIGGIIGTITDVSDDEVTLKIDESTNTKIKVIPSAIGKNLSEEKGK